MSLSRAGRGVAGRPAAGPHSVPRVPLIAPPVAGQGGAYRRTGRRRYCGPILRPILGGWSPMPFTDRTEGYLAAMVGGGARPRWRLSTAVGSLALGDFSDRQSNIDLVVVADPRLDPAELPRLARAARGMRRAGRDARGVACDLGGSRRRGSGSARRRPERAGDQLARHPDDQGHPPPRPMALFGPDWPVVGYDPAVLRDWCRDPPAGPGVQQSTALLVMRRAIGPLVLEAARLTQGSHHRPGGVQIRGRRSWPCHRVDQPPAAADRRGWLPAGGPDLDVLGSLRAEIRRPDPCCADLLEARPPPPEALSLFRQPRSTRVARGAESRRTARPARRC